MGGRGIDAIELLDRLTVRGIALRVVDDRIQATPMSAIGPDEREQLQLFKPELLTLLRGPADEFLEDRAAIREFDGKLSRADSERLAAHDCKRPCD